MEIKLCLWPISIHKDCDFSDVKTRKTKRQPSITKNEMFRNIIKQVSTNHIKFEYALADNWFGVKGNKVSLLLLLY